MPANLETRMLSVFREVFGNATLVITPETTAADVDGWDSLSHIRLLVAIEREFQIKFKLGEVSGLKNVGEMLEAVKKKSSEAEKSS